MGRGVELGEVCPGRRLTTDVVLGQTPVGWRRAPAAGGACEHRRMTAHVAFLRVYEPLDAFDGEQRRSWEAYLAGRRWLPTADGVAQERAAALRALVGDPPRALPVLDEHAHVAEVDGATLLCPWRTRLRALEALEEFVADLPDEVVEAFVPLPLVAAAGAELDGWREAHPGRRSHQLSSRWQVPLRWFVLVDAEERDARLGQPTTGGGTPVHRRAGRSLVYRTAMSRARRRTARALSVLRRTVDEGAMTAAVEDLGRWLEEFHPRSLVELDYGGLVHLLDDAALQEDESARDVAAALAALADGDPDTAEAAYERVLSRMNALQAVESAS